MILTIFLFLNPHNTHKYLYEFPNVFLTKYRAIRLIDFKGRYLNHVTIAAWPHNLCGNFRSSTFQTLFLTSNSKIKFRFPLWESLPPVNNSLPLNTTADASDLVICGEERRRVVSVDFRCFWMGEGGFWGIWTSKILTDFVQF